MTYPQIREAYRQRRFYAVGAFSFCRLQAVRNRFQYFRIIPAHAPAHFIQCPASRDSFGFDLGQIKENSKQSRSQRDFMACHPSSGKPEPSNLLF